MSKKRVAFIGVKGIPANFDGMGGIEVRVEKIAQELVDKDFKVDVFVRNWATPKSLTKHRGANLIHLPTINTKHLDAGIHSLLASIFVCFSKDKLIFYEAMGPAFFSFLPKLVGKKIVTTIHGLDWQRDKWGPIAKLFLRIGEKIALKTSDKVVVVSSALQKYYKKQGVQTMLIPNEMGFKERVSAKIIKKKYGFMGDDYILYLGRFVPEKRIEWLIKAYKKISCQKKLLLVGGPSHSEDYVKKLKKLALKDKNIIFTGYIFGKEKEELLSNCGLFVQPSKLEGFSIALAEAIGYRRPVLAADIEVNKELMVDKNFLFQNNSFKNFCTKFSNLIKKQKISFKIKKSLFKNSWTQLLLKIIQELN